MISSFRRNFLSGAAALAATAALAPLRAQVPAKPKTRLILLGTGGGPRIVAPGRSKSANLIVANGVPYVVDCGEGVAHQLVRAGVVLNTLRRTDKLKIAKCALVFFFRALSSFLQKPLHALAVLCFWLCFVASVFRFASARQ